MEKIAKNQQINEDLEEETTASRDSLNRLTSINQHAPQTMKERKSTIHYQTCALHCDCAVSEGGDDDGAREESDDWPNGSSDEDGAVGGSGAAWPRSGCPRWEDDDDGSCTNVDDGAVSEGGDDDGAREESDDDNGSCDEDGAVGGSGAAWPSSGCPRWEDDDDGSCTNVENGGDSIDRDEFCLAAK